MMNNSELTNNGMIIDECFALETSCYPSDEAATREKIEYRFKHVGDFFLLERKPGGGQLIGMLNCTRSNEESIGEETMKTSHANGRFLCIHSVAVLESERKRGVGSLLLQRVIQAARKNKSIEKIVLVTKGKLISFYNKNGFGNVINSSLTHGKDKWYVILLKNENIDQCAKGIK